MEVTAYNVKSKQHEVILNANIVTLANGRKAVRGNNENGDKLYRILGAKEAEELEAALA